jgi:hypothetical protein
MKSISSARKSSRGRPRVNAVPINTRFPPGDLKRLDAWIARQIDKPSRPEAIRRLVEQALGAPAGPVKAGSRRKAAELAGRAIDTLGDQTATVEERTHRKHRLIKGPREFRDVRGDQPKRKG